MKAPSFDRYKAFSSLLWYSRPIPGGKISTRRSYVLAAVVDQRSFRRITAGTWRGSARAITKQNAGPSQSRRSYL